MRADLKFPFYAKASLVFIGIFAFVSMLFIAREIIVPIIYSIIVAIVLSPIVDYFVSKKMNRVVAIVITLMLLIILTVLIVTLLSNQILQFSDSFPKLLEKFQQLLEQAVIWASDYFNISERKINLWIAAKKVEILNGSSGSIGRTIMNTGSILIILVLIPVYIFMILYYQPLLLEFIHRLFRVSSQNKVNEVLLSTKKIIRSYLVGLLLEAAIVATLNSVSMLIIGIDYAIILGVMGAILNFIPYLGGIVAAGLSVAITLATTSSLSYCLLVLASFIVIQLIDNNFIIPKIVASRVKINALVSIIVVIIGGALWGIPGMFLSIPLTAIIKVVFDHIEALKPWGFLLGDTMPLFLGIKFPFKNKLIIKQIQTSK